MSEGTQRGLAAIVAADVVGYSRLMGVDEEGTLAALEAHRRELVDPKVAEHRGRIVKTTGDGLLLEFTSVLDAVRCSVAVQRAMAERNAGEPEDRRMQFCVGINLGDIIIDRDDIHGDGVNVAARLEALSERGGIAISGNVHEQVEGKTDAQFVDDGSHKVKNIAKPMQVWRWSPAGTPIAAVAETGGDDPLPLPDKPSIAVLPFDNMSGDPEQEFFADGIAEDVITALSRFRSLFVIARNSSFTYKGSAVDVTQVARELGVRYVVEGSVRTAGNRVRITAQLIDAASGNHLWADRFDGDLDDVFDLQDQITEQIVVEVEPEIGARERERARRKSPESLDAWQLFQRGLSHFYRYNKTDRAEAIRLFREAIVLDPDFALAYAHLSFTLSSSVLWGYVEDRAEVMASARVAAERAVSLDMNEPMAHFSLGRAHIFDGEVEIGLGEQQAAIAINPNFARGHFGLGWARYHGAGQAEQALPHFDTALRLRPRDPTRWAALMMKGSVLRDLGRHDQAVAYCRQACQFPDSPFGPQLYLACALADAGQISEAQAAIDKAIQLQPSLSVAFFHGLYPGAHETFLKSLFVSLRKAGLPE